MEQDDFKERFKLETVPVTAEDVQSAIELISRAGFEINAKFYELARLGREQMAAEFASGLYKDNTEHAFFYRKGDERLCLSWDYKRNTARISLEKILPGELLCRAGNRQVFTLPEFAAYIRSRNNPPFGSAPQTPSPN